MADEPAPIPLDALDLESLSDEELQRLNVDLDDWGRAHAG